MTKLSLKSDQTALGLGVCFCVLFTGLIALLGHHLANVPHVEDQGPGWYYWILAEQTTMGQISAWSLYLVHQLGHWSLIYWGQTNIQVPVSGLHPLHITALAFNAIFIFLHLIQTHMFYDGLAQDTNVVAPLAAVSVMLIWVLLMENNRRGMFFCSPAPFSRELVAFARRTHGYYFSWAILYTFWFHPMEATSGHLWGFFYTLLLMLQGSLFLTRVHMNRWWTVCLEVTVLIHGTMVALMQPYGLAPMFAFGFGGVFVITQMHGLGWSKHLRLAMFLAWLLPCVWIYKGKATSKLNEPFRIPIIDYVGVFVLAAILSAVKRLLSFRHVEVEQKLN